MQIPEGRAAWPSLLFFCAALLSLAGSVLAGYWYLWWAFALLIAASAPWRALPANALCAATALLCAWFFTGAAWLTPHYVAQSIYLPALLLASFVAIAALPHAAKLQVFRAGVMLLVALVFLALLQYFFGFWQFSTAPRRAAATFITPNSFATAINLFLAPLAALYAAAHGSRRVYILSLWLFAGLVASESRGGMLALFAALGIVAASVAPSALWRLRMRWCRLLGGWLAVWLAFVAAASLLESVLHKSAGIGASLQTWFARGIWDRSEIYGTTLNLILERPFAGAGSNMFGPLFEAAKSETFAGIRIYFVHNDFLQAWLEYGLGGLILLVAMMSLALGHALRSSRSDPGDALPLACGAGCAACFAHAMVDFPLAIPFVLVIIGGYMGALAAHEGSSGRAGSALAWMRGRSGRFITLPIRYAIVIAALAWLGQPALAEFALDRTASLLKEGDVRRALYWQSVAQRLEPRDAAFSWAGAIIWRDQAEATRDKAFAALADRLFADCAQADPFRIDCYLERARLHRLHAELFERPAPPQQVLVWTREALRLNPYSVTAGAEHARALAFAGRIGDARRLVRSMLERYPKSELVRDVAAELWQS